MNVERGFKLIGMQKERRRERERGYTVTDNFTLERQR